MPSNETKRKFKLPNFSYFLLIYIILATGWWTILLFRLNREAHEAQLKLYNLEQKLKNNGLNETPENIELVTNQFKRKKNMIAGETLFFLISIISGVIIIYQANRARIDLARRQRNFILAVTHELKTPLTAIQMVLETFGRRNPTADQQKLLISGAMEETKRLRHLVENLLVVARSGELKNNTKHISDVHIYLQEIKDRYMQTYPMASIKLYTGAVKSTVRSTKDDIYQIFTNLFDNAFKYAGENCKITIQTHDDGDNLNIEFSDNGPGIPDNEKENIFKLFYRIGAEDYHHKPGTGLGLFIVHSLVTQLQGSINLKNNSPSGLIINIKLKTI